MTKRGTWWTLAVGCGALVGASVLGVVGLAGLMIWSSRGAIRDFDALASRTTTGTPLVTLLDDGFVQGCAMVVVSGPFEARTDFPDDASAHRALLKRLREHPGAAAGKGQLELMWVHLPPFGRLFLRVDFEDGKITAAKTSSLD